MDQTIAFQLAQTLSMIPENAMKTYKKGLFGKLKQYLGIEGIKLELHLPEACSPTAGILSGTMVLTTMHHQVVTFMKITLMEKYSRGRGKERRTDEYILGEIALETSLDVAAGSPLEIPFRLPFAMVKSGMDHMQDKTLLSPLAKTAKWIQGVRSEYYVQAELTVKGTALNPFDKKPIRLTD